MHTVSTQQPEARPCQPQQCHPLTKAAHTAVLLSVLLWLMLMAQTLQAAVTSGMGEFTVTSSTPNSATGRYIAANGGGTGSFTIQLNSIAGYGAIEFQDGSNGLMIKHNGSNVPNDRFNYTLTLIPDSSDVVNTVKIAQTSYNTSGGNSEVARQTLSYTNDSATGATARAYVGNNNPVPMYYNAMGDYFMGRRRYSSSSSWVYTESGYTTQQLRGNSGTDLFYYKFAYLNRYLGSNGDSFLYLDNDGYVTKTTSIGVLPPNPIVSNILKSSSTNPNNQNTYPPLATNSTIDSGSSYVSYGVENAESSYEIHIKNPKSVTLDYQAIMRGNSINTNIGANTGETSAEWISFGIESTLPPNVIPTPPNVPNLTCPAGMIADSFAATDYDELAPNTTPQPNPQNNINIIGTQNESYLITSNRLSNASISGSSNYYRRSNTFTIYPAFEFFQDFTSGAATRSVTYNFTNQFTNAPQALSNVSLSIFDIDANHWGNIGSTYWYEFKDAAKVTGTKVDGSTISPVLTFNGTTIKRDNNGFYTQDVYNRSLMCSNSIADGNCQVSFSFAEPVISVTVEYGNSDYNSGYYYIRYATDIDNNGYLAGLDNPGDQLINIKFDGYCYTPQPRLSLSKVLADERIADSDQFTVQIKDGNTVVNNTSNSTTTGSGSTVDTGTGTTGVFKINPTMRYALAEVAAGTTNLSQYQATYECKDKSTQQSITTLDPNAIQMTYGDNWQCTITNTPRQYSFSGYVFNDNGGISSPNPQQLDSPYAGNEQYFNGVFDRTGTNRESGIAYTNGHTITVSSCDDGGVGFAARTVNISQDGFYSFSITQEQIADNTQLCFTQNEPENYIYSVDTTSNVQTVILQPNQYDYEDINFGDVVADNAALVLEKLQYVHECGSIASYDDASINQPSNESDTGGDATTGFSKAKADEVAPGKCIAYKIRASNRGHVALSNVIISDTLQNDSVTSTAYQYPNVGVGVDTGNSPDIGYNGTVKSKPFDLKGRINNTYDSRVLYFNTRYGNP